MNKSVGIFFVKNNETLHSLTKIHIQTDVLKKD